MNRQIVKTLVAAAMLMIVLVAASAVQAINPPHNLVCNVCHVANRVYGVTAPYNVCLQCHQSGQSAGVNPYTLQDMANPFGTFTSTLPGTKTQSSHNWSAPSNFPAAGSQEAQDPSMTLKASLNGTVSCSRCHEIHGSYTSARYKPLLRMPNDSDQMCLDCHRQRNTTTSSALDAAQQGTHPVSFGYNDPSSKVTLKPTEYYATPQNSNPANPTAALKLINGKVLCSTCHKVHFADSNSNTFHNHSSAMQGKLSSSTGILLRTNMFGKTTASVNICTNCHNKPNHSNTSNIQCADCHAGHVDYDPLDPNGTLTKNVYLVRRYMNFSGSVKLPTYRRRVFYQYTATSKKVFNGGSTTVCIACHVPPTGGSFPPEHSSTNPTICSTCHNHSSGFTAPQNNLVCGQCHGMPPIKNIWGTYSSGIGGYAVYSSTRNPNKVPGSTITYSYRYNPYPTQNVAFKSEYSTAHRRHANGQNASDTASYGFGCNECHYDTSASKGWQAANHRQRTYQNVFVSVTSAVAVTAPQAMTGSGSGAGNRPKYNTSSPGSCSNIYCHSNGDPRPTLSRYSSLSISWSKWPYSAANPDKKRLGCNGCHRTGNNLTSNAHVKHVNTVTGKGLSCAVCHNATVTFTSIYANNTTIVLTKDANNKTVTTHVNGAKEVNFTPTFNPPLSDAGWNSGAATCAIYCHSDAKGGPAVGGASSWTTPNSGKCGTCHFTSPAISAFSAQTISTDGHDAHLNRTYGPGPVYFYNISSGIRAGSTCKKCHTAFTTDLGQGHVNGTKEVDFATYCQGCHPNDTRNVAFWQSSQRLSCSTCHPISVGSVASKLPNNVQVNRMDNYSTAAGTSNTAGHGAKRLLTTNQKVNCTDCHDPNRNHISGQLKDSTRPFAIYSGPSLANNLCFNCHNDASKVPATKLNMKPHVIDYLPTPTLGLCTTCHSTHGTTNRNMLRTTLFVNFSGGKTVPITFDSSNAPYGFINTTDWRGLCQVCHSVTKHFRRGTVEPVNGFGGSWDHSSYNVTTNCMSCHSHSTGTYAFLPSGGDCSSCHGYPPASATAMATKGANYVDAKFQNYTGGGGAHTVPGHVPYTAVKAAGLTNCTACHYNVTAHSSRTVDKPETLASTGPNGPIVIVDPQFTFNPMSSIRYSGVFVARPNNKTGQCTNVSCHFTASPKWSSER